ncbi:MAG: hypothetical protein NTY53_12315 [Kiritimatiellaeota bacterium]|nr:hypothetical protein [Kiritimatiellota bacterium]
MKKVLWMLVAVAMLGFGVSTMAKDKPAGGDKGAKPTPVTVSGTVKVDGDVVKIVTEDKTEYILAKSCADAYKAKDGEKVTDLKGMCKEGKDGKKMLMIGGGHGKKKDAGAAAPAAGGDKK